MSSVTRRVACSLAIGSALALFGASAGPGSAAAAPVALKAAAPAVAAISLPFGFDVDNTTSRVAKIGSDLSFGHGSFDGALTGISGAVPLHGTLTLPPASGYFVTFHFMPVTATATLVPDGEATGTATIISQGGLSADTDLTVKEFVQLTDVKVDKVPLEVGPNCRTATSALVHVKALLPLVKPGAPKVVTSSFTLPAFAGCGVTEDLSPLMTGLVSGPGNTLTTTLTLRCVSTADCAK